MKQTVILPAHLFPAAPDAAPLVAVVERWEKTLGQTVMAGETLAFLRAGDATFAVTSPAWGVLTRKCALPGEAVEAGEPVAVLGGVSAPLDGIAATPVPLVASPPGNHESSADTVFDHHRRSLQQTPHAYAVTLADVSEALRYIAKTGRGETVSGVPETLTLLPFVLCAAAGCVSRFPQITDEMHPAPVVSVGVETYDPAGGLVVPVIQNAHSKSILAVAREWAGYESRIARNALGVADVCGATFTVSLTPHVLYRTPVLHAPLAAHLSCGKTVGDTVHLCLAYDASRVSGQVAEAFLADVAHELSCGGFTLR